MIEAGFNKPYWWDGNLAWLRKQRRLWQDGKLAYAYREMIGISGHRMYERLEKLLLSPTFFEGVDIDPSVLMEHALAGLDGLSKKRPFRLVYADFFASTAERARMPNLPLGVVNADAQNAVTTAFWQAHAPILGQIVASGILTCPAFTLILNLPADIGSGKGMTFDRQLAVFAEGFVATFPGWNLRASDFLRGAEGAGDRTAPLDSPPLKVGRFDIYRSENRRVRMITVRATFQKKRRLVLFDER